MYIGLISTALREEKLEEIVAISNNFYKFFTLRNSTEKLNENDVSEVYFPAEKFFADFPKSHQVFKKNNEYFNALRYFLFVRDMDLLFLTERL